MIQAVLPTNPIMERVQRHLPVGAAVVLVVERDIAVAKYMDPTGVECCSFPFGDHVSLQEALVVAARAGKQHISEAKILNAVRECVTLVRSEESTEAALIHGFHLLAKHTTSHYAMRRLRSSLDTERQRRVEAEELAERLQQRLLEAELACEECGAPEDVMEALRGE